MTNRWKFLTNQHRFPLLPLLFILHSVLIYNQSMSTKEQISSLCKLYSVYEEVPEEFWDETDVDSNFYHNILDISQSHHRIVRVSIGSNKKIFCIQSLSFLKSYGSDLFSRKKSAFPKMKFSLYSTVWVNFSKLWSSQQSIADSITQT